MNEQTDLSGSPLASIATTTIVLSAFAGDLFNPVNQDLSITEIQVDGSVVPEPGSRSPRGATKAAGS